jgi:hypothetical protein
MTKDDVNIHFDCDGALIWAFVFGKKNLPEQLIIDAVKDDTGLTDGELREHGEWPPSIQSWHIRVDPEMKNPDFDEFWVKCDASDDGSKLVTGHRF